MLKAIVLLVLGVGVAQPAFAGPIVTWEAFGLTTGVVNRYPVSPDPLPPGPPPPPQGPPIGTPWSLSVSLDPDARLHTALSGASDPCYTTPIAGAFNLGGVGYTFSSNQAFSNAGLPNNPCVATNPLRGEIDFWMFPEPVAGDPWRLSDYGPFFLLASYRELIATDGSFPDLPTYMQPGSLFYNNDSYQFFGRFAPTAVIDDPNPSPVPEPGTMALMGIGLAYGAQRRWRARRQ